MKASRIIFFGNERLATGVTTTAPTLQSLIDNGYEVSAVVSSYSEARSRQSRRLEIAEVAKKHNVPLLLPSTLDGLDDDLSQYGAPAAVLVAYGRLIPAKIIDLFPRGIINIHPSLLPEYRGPTPIESAILNGAAKTGVSIMQLAPEMDAGPVFAQGELNLKGNETKQQLADKLLELGGRLLLEYLPSILDGSAAAIEQNHAAASYTKLITKNDGLISWDKPAEQLEREVRAYAGWPKSHAKIHGQEVIITSVRVAKGKSDGDLVMKCNPGYLAVQELIAPSGKTMRAAEFLRGYRS